MSSDIKIARAHKMLHIEQIAHKLNIDSEDLELYGKYKAKVPLSYKIKSTGKKGALVLVSAISPTPAGEGNWSYPGYEQTRSPDNRCSQGAFPWSGIRH